MPIMPTSRASFWTVRSATATLPSLVYEERRSHSRISRCRAATHDDEGPPVPGRNQLAVRRRSRNHAGIVAVRLARAFLEGPQDLSISDEASDVARKIWEGLGGTTALLRSLHWTRPLRPATLAVATVCGPGTAGTAGGVRRVRWRAMVDAMATRMPHSHFHQCQARGIVGRGR